MKFSLFVIPISTILFTGCDVQRAMDQNREAIEYSTCVIYENAQAVEGANRAIEQNRKQLEEINQTLQKAAQH